MDLTKQLIEPKTEDNVTTKIGFGFIALLLFIAGIFITPSNIIPSLEPLRPQYLFGIIAAIGLIFGLLTKAQKLNWTSIHTAYSIFLIATILSLINLESHSLLSNAMDRLNYTFKTWAMLILIGSFTSNPRLFKICFNFFLFVVGIFQLHCLKAIFAGVAIVEGRFDSWVGQISNPDFIGTFFAFMVPIQLEKFLQEKKLLIKGIFLASALVSIFIMVKTQTRTAFFILLLVLILWTIIRENSKKRITIGIIIFLIFLLFGLSTKASTEYHGGFFRRMQVALIAEERDADENFQLRKYLWQQGIQIWSKFPFFGSGVGGMDPHQTLEDGVDPIEGMGLSSYSLHQSFIQAFAERGIIGGISYILFIYLIFRHLSRTKRHLRDSNFRSEFFSIATGLQLTMIGVVIGSFFMTLQETWVLIFFAAFTSALYKATQLIKEDLKQSN